MSGPSQSQAIRGEQSGTDDQARYVQLDYKPLDDFTNGKNCASIRVDWPFAFQSKVAPMSYTHAKTEQHVHISAASPIVTFTARFSPYEEAKEDLYEQSLKIVKAVRAKDYKALPAAILLKNHKTHELVAHKTVHGCIAQEVSFRMIHGSPVQIIFTLHGLLYEQADVA